MLRGDVRADAKHSLYHFNIQNIILTFAVPERRYVGNYDHYQRKRRRIIRQGSKAL